MGRTGRNFRKIQRQSGWKTESYFTQDSDPNRGKTFRGEWRSIDSLWNENEYRNNCGMFKFTN